MAAVTSSTGRSRFAHRKTRRVLVSHPGKRRDAAPMGIWLLAASWAGLNNTSGWVPEFELDSFDDDWESLVERLVKAEYWWPEERAGEPGYGFVNWHEYNDLGTVTDKAGFAAHVRWHVSRGQVSPDCPHCPREPVDEPAPDDADPMPEQMHAYADAMHRNAPADAQAMRAMPQPEPEPEPASEPTSLRSVGGAGGGSAPSTGLALVADSTTAVAAAPTPKRRGTRLPTDWAPARSEANIAAEKGHTSEFLTGQFEQFRDYWTAKAGANGTKLDWDATWRNWIRRSSQFAPTKPTRARTAGSLTEAEWQQMIERSPA
jgi:hypothetical protein